MDARAKTVREILHSRFQRILHILGMRRCGGNDAPPAEAQNARRQQYRSRAAGDEGSMERIGEMGGTARSREPPHLK